MPTVTREMALPVDPEEAWADGGEVERLAGPIAIARRLRAPALAPA